MRGLLNISTTHRFLGINREALVKMCDRNGEDKFPCVMTAGETRPRYRFFIPAVAQWLSDNSRGEPKPDSAAFERALLEFTGQNPEAEKEDE